MLAKPRSLNTIGIIQTLLATAFVIWLAFFPDTAGNFAWPIDIPLMAVFIGAGFTGRAYLGYHLWREKEWWRLRWQVWGNMGFLAIVFVATFWHLSEMNWTTSIILVHIWVVAYSTEPLILWLIEPRGEKANEPISAELREGPISRGLQLTMGIVFVSMFIVSALLFITPEFADTRWPWELDPFNARIAAAFPMLAALWAARVYFMDDWAEAKLGVRGLLVMGSAYIVAYFVYLSRYDFDRANGVVYIVTLVIFTAIIAYFYWRQERARKEFVSAENKSSSPS